MTCGALRRHTYLGQWAAIATMHGKERAIAPVLCRWLDMTVTTAPGIDTDSLGTFTDEIARKGTMLDAARAKACLAIERTGARLGIGSEGAFGPDPHLPFVASGFELILLRDAVTGHEIVVSRRTRANYDHVTVAPTESIDAFLDRIGFPSHAVVVCGEPLCGRDPIKGLITRSSVDAALRLVFENSLYATLQTDMRAHLNPTRMAAIGRLARGLAVRTARCCPSCNTPGFGRIDVERGLTCRDCNMPTRLIRAEIHGCSVCGYKITKRARPAGSRADPTYCDMCNP